MEDGWLMTGDIDYIYHHVCDKHMILFCIICLLIVNNDETAFEGMSRGLVEEVTRGALIYFETNTALGNRCESSLNWFTTNTTGWRVGKEEEMFGIGGWIIADIGLFDTEEIGATTVEMKNWSILSINMDWIIGLIVFSPLMSFLGTERNNKFLTTRWRRSRRWWR